MQMKVELKKLLRQNAVRQRAAPSKAAQNQELFPVRIIVGRPDRVRRWFQEQVQLDVAAMQDIRAGEGNQS
jgi:hypothetical protein